MAGVKDITFHYTKPEMVQDLLARTPITGSVLDAGSGKNKVWYKALNCEEKVVSDKRWFGRYYWVILTREGSGFIDSIEKTY